MIEQERGETTLRDLPKEIDECRRIILGELRQRSLWFIRLRWWVPPAIVLGTFLALSIGAQLEAGFLLGVALFVLAYNIFSHLWSRRLKRESDDSTIPFQYFISWQVCLDYAAIFLILHFTGGAASPFIFLFIFHVIFTAILLPRWLSCTFAAIVPAGIGLIGGLEYAGWIPHRPLVYQGTAIDIVEWLCC